MWKDAQPAPTGNGPGLGGREMSAVNPVPGIGVGNGKDRLVQILC